MGSEQSDTVDFVAEVTLSGYEGLAKRIEAKLAEKLKEQLAAREANEAEKQ